MQAQIQLEDHFVLECWAHAHADGSKCPAPWDCPRGLAFDQHQHALKWRDEFDNLVTTVGKNDLLDKYFKGSAYTATWYVGLVDGGSAPTYAAGDTMGSHSGWTENTGYSNANRPTLTLGTPSGGSVDNSASKAVFNINASGTIAGAFIATNNTKGGTTGTLYGEGNFAEGNRSVVNGDTLNVTVTLTAS